MLDPRQRGSITEGVEPQELAGSLHATGLWERE